MTTSYLEIKKLVADEEDIEEDDEDDEEEEEEEEERVAVDVKKKKQKMKKSSNANEGSAAGGPWCLVESCEADLSGCKKYHQRHRVCEVHAKAPVVLLDGFRQRFCQQCSRFHEISEFDQSKRSCRRRLAGHNERRRKSSLESQREGSSSARRRYKELKAGLDGLI